MGNPWEYEWKEVDKDLWPIAYESDAGHLLYVEDQYKNKHPFNQTDFSDFDDERYKMVLDSPGFPELDVLHETDDWSEVEAYVEYFVGDLE